MTDGFLGYDTSLMLDVVVCALVLVVPLLLYSIYQVKFRRNYVRHRNLQIGLGAVLLITVAAFEIDMQLVHGGWENVANKPGREPRLLAEPLAAARRMLYLHLIFAVSTPVLWATTLILALKKFGSPPAPSAHSRVHKTLGWIATLDLVLTSTTGLVFYYVAFVSAQ